MNNNFFNLNHNKVIDLVININYDICISTSIFVIDNVCSYICSRPPVLSWLCEYQNV
jgi:hypothetical protein